MKPSLTLPACVVLLCFLSVGCKQKPQNPPAPAPSAAPAASAASAGHDPSGPISEAALGLKIYPGARIVTSGETPEVVSANLQTADAPEQVIQFYRQQLGLPADGPATMDLSAKKDNRVYAISVTRSEGITSVSILGKK